MVQLVVPIGEVPAGAGADLLGGKGAALCRLAAAGFPVPSGFVVTTEAFRAALGGSLLLSCASPAEAAARIAGAPLPRALEVALSAAYHDLVAAASRDLASAQPADAGPPLLAVRSSSTCEDGAAGSHAGLGLTELGVAGEDGLRGAIRRVWASIFRLEGLLYEPAPSSSTTSRRSLSLAARPPEMAVVVQRLVHADAAGVLFTANPVTRAPDEALLQAAHGLGVSVVDGADADTWVLDRRDGAVRSRRIAPKRHRVRASEHGTVAQELGDAEAAAPALADSQVAEIAALGRRVERHAGAPQDVEWAVAGERTWLLQARPITTLAPGPRRRVLWSNANVGESLPGVASPITWSIIGDYARRGFTDAFAGLGLTLPADRDFVGSVRGRIYLNLTEFLAVIGQIPFLSARTLLALAGVSASVLPEAPVERRSPVGFLARLPLSAARFAVNHFAAPLRARLTERGYARRRDDLLGDDLEGVGRRVLAARLASVHERLADRGGLLLSVSSNFLASWVACREVLRVAGAETAEEDLGTLFSGLGGVVSAEPGLALLDLAHVARREPEAAAALRAGLGGGQLRDALAATAGGRRFAEALAEFLGRYGLRAAREAEIATPRWREDPTFVLDVVRLHLEAPSLPTAAERASARERLRAETTRRVLASLPRGTRTAFRRLLAHAQDVGRLRERLRTQVVEVLGLYRHVLLAIGRRLVTLGLAGAPDDVFALSLDEVEAWLAGRTPEALPVRIAYRRARLAALEAATPPPDTFVVTEGEPAPPSASPPAGDGPRLHGSPASPGRASGRVRIVRDPRGAPLRHGEILVAPYADAGWTPLFLAAAAVVLETGGPLSHACVVAREMGVPVVTGVAHATGRLRDGDVVTVDAHAGIVQLTGERRRSGAARAAERERATGPAPSPARGAGDRSA